MAVNLLMLAKTLYFIAFVDNGGIAVLKAIPEDQNLPFTFC